MEKINFCLRHIFVSTLIFTLFVITSGNLNQTEGKSVSEIQLDSNVKPMVVPKESANGRSIKDNSDNSLEKPKRNDQKNRESIRKEKDMYDIMRLHQMSSNNEFNKELKADQEKKDQKGKLQTVGGVVGEIIAVIVSEVVKLFGNMVSDVAREVTAHGFVSIFKQFTDLTGISLPENII